MGITEAAGTNKTLEINGKQLQMRPIGVEDTAVYKEYLVNKKLKSLTIVLSSLDAIERKEMIREAMNISDAELFQELTTADGIVFMMKRSLDINKDLLPDDLNEIFSRWDELQDMFSSIMPKGDSTENPPLPEKQGSP